MTNIQRLRAVARFYFPRLKNQLIWYPIISLLLGLVTTMCFFTKSSSLFLLSIIGDAFILSILMEYGPLAFAIHSSPEMETTLPATGKEKATFIICYTFIVLPLLLIAPITVIDLFFHRPFNELLLSIPQMSTIATESISIKTGIFSFLQYIVPTSVCLYAVMYYARKRVVYGIVWTITANVIMAITGFFCGATTAFIAGYNDGRNGVELSEDAIANKMVSVVEPVIEWCCVILAICLIFVIYKTYRAIRFRQM